MYALFLPIAAKVYTRVTVHDGQRNQDELYIIFQGWRNSFNSFLIVLINKIIPRDHQSI